MSTKSTSITQTVKSPENGRLDQICALTHPLLSRSQIQRLIRQGRVQVDQEVIIKPSFQVKTGQFLTFDSDSTDTIKDEPIQPQLIPLNIIFEDDQVIVINKPAGLTIHPTNRQKSNTLVNALLSYCPTIYQVGQPNRPGIVHRLDRYTSGVMIIAKTQTAYRYLVGQFKSRQVKKAYLALVHGDLREERGTISFSLSPRPRANLKVKTRILEGAKPALTQYQVLRRLHLNDDHKKSYTLLKAHPQTGRRHQIRVHLAKIGHPVVGDHLYQFKNHPQIPGLARQFLHAETLSLKLPDQPSQTWRAPLGDDLKQALKQLSENT